MIFSSILFLFIFLPVVLALYYLVPSRLKNLVLLLASLVFYAWGEPLYVVLMLFSTVFNFIIGLNLRSLGRLGLLASVNLDDGHSGKASNGSAAACHRMRLHTILFAVIVNLGMLFYFKYMGFASGVFGFPFKEIALPIGISFYTFQTMSYIIDVYRGNVPAQTNYIDFAAYITMFPQLIAGPIVKYVDIEKQLKSRLVTFAIFGEGCEIFIRGLAKKVLLANNIGQLATTVMSMEPASRSAATAWLGALAYTMQIFFDFSGYSDMAIGLGRMFGFKFLKNFDYPYLSKSISEFWRRWHISLGQWFREYVYIPLGGNRVSVWRHLCNIFVVWLLTGLWHGAGWNFICWGLYYGIILCVEKYLIGNRLTRLPSWVSSVYTMLLVVFGWVLFMNNDLRSAGIYIGEMFGANGYLADESAWYYLQNYFLTFVLCALCCTRVPLTWLEKARTKAPIASAIVNALMLLACAAYLVYETYNPFLYFRF